MKRIIATGAVAALAMVGVAGTASAAPGGNPGPTGKPADSGIECQQFGHGFLRSAGLLTTVAQDGLEFGGVTYSLSQVLAIHRTAPATANVVLKSVAPEAASAIDAACPA